MQHLGKMASVVQRVDSTLHWINPSSLENAIGFDSSNPMDGCFSAGWHHPIVKQLRPVWYENTRLACLRKCCHLFWV